MGKEEKPIKEKSKEEIIEYLKEKISKSGFKLELNSALTLINKGWDVRNNIYYFDTKLKEYSELDILAEKKHKDIPKAFCYLIIECKKQDECPWVFFKKNNIHKEVFTINLLTKNKYHEGIYDWFKKFKFDNHHYFKFPLSSHHLPYLKEGNRIKKEIRGDQIRIAVNKVLDALTYYAYRDEKTIEKFANVDHRIYYPIIILQGKLFLAELKQGNIELEEKKHIQLLIERELDDPVTLTLEKMPFIHSNKPFIIDIISSDYLDNFLEIL